MAKISKETFIQSVPEVATKPKNDKILAKSVHLGLGVDLLGSSTSLNHKRGNELEVTALGIKATGKKSARVVLIPWANIKGVELMKDGEE